MHFSLTCFQDFVSQPFNCSPSASTMTVTGRINEMHTIKQQKSQQIKQLQLQNLKLSRKKYTNNGGNNLN